MSSKIVLAFSGGLDTSAIIPWLTENYQSDVIAYAANVGLGCNEQELRDQALCLGASELIYEDLRDEFASRFVWPMLRAGAKYQDDYLLGTAIARPLIAERVATIARRIGADSIAHGATGKGNDQLRFERSWAHLVPDCKVIAPWRTWPFQSRADLKSYLKGKGVDFSFEDKTYSVDDNLLHISSEGGELEHIETVYDPAPLYQIVAAQPEPAGPERFEIGFSKGSVTSLNGKALSPRDTLLTLNRIAGRYGIGIVDLVEERTNGVKSRGIYETPGGTVIDFATRQLKHMCWDREQIKIANALGEKYGELIYDGLWHSPLRASIDTFFEHAAEMLEGRITIELSPHTIKVLARESSTSLYDADLVSFESDDFGLHKAADGFCAFMTHRCRQAGLRRGLL